MNELALMHNTAMQGRGVSHREHAYDIWALGGGRGGGLGQYGRKKAILGVLYCDIQGLESVSASSATSLKR